MVKTLLDALYTKVRYIYKDKYNNNQIIYIYLLITFVICNGIFNVFFAILCLAINLSELAIIASISIIVFLVCITLCLLGKKVDYILSLTVLAICFYIISCSYLLGYDKNAFVLLIPLFFAVYTLSFSSSLAFVFWTAVLFITYCINLYIRYFTTPIYNDNYKIIGYINLAIAFLSLFFIVYAKRVGVEYYKNQTEKRIYQLSEEAKMDFLTGLQNRTSMEKMFSEYEFSTNSFIIIGDIDFFKYVNDSYGHIVGDIVLKDIAKIMLEHFQNDIYISRWGGEEFLLFVKEGKSFDIINDIECLRKKISTANIYDGNNIINVTITFGVKQVEPDKNIMKNIDDADTALYYGKEHGRNQTVYYTDITPES
ncbi:MAG: GGDEF domain-containing protein [Lachnospirales bacterium]